MRAEDPRVVVFPFSLFKGLDTNGGGLTEEFNDRSYVLLANVSKEKSNMLLWFFFVLFTLSSVFLYV